MTINPCQKLLNTHNGCLAWLLVFLGPIALGLVIFYALFLPMALMLGMSFQEATVLYLAEAIVALDPVLVVIVGSWLLLCYLFSLCVPPAEAIDRGNTLILHGLYTFKTLVVSAVLQLLPVHTLAFASTTQGVRLDPDLRRQSKRCTTRRRLTFAWFPGSNPALLYELA